MDLQTLKNNYAQEHGYEDWYDLQIQTFDKWLMDNHWTEICIRAQKLALEKAAENATMLFDAVYDWHSVNKESITNEENLIL
jgi:hypothetical protein